MKKGKEKQTVVLSADDKLAERIRSSWKVCGARRVVVNEPKIDLGISLTHQ